MRKYLTFLLLLVIGLAHSTSWTTTSLKCNDYEYTMAGTYGIQFPRICDANHNLLVTVGLPSYNDMYYINNTGTICIMNHAYCYDLCPTSDCSFYFVWGTNCTSYSVTSDLTTPPYYSGCAIPHLNIVNSYPSTIMTDRYRVNFTIDNSFGWSGVTCSLSLNGINHYSTTFNSNGSIDVLYTIYPKEFTIASVLCTYTNENNNTVTFAEMDFLLDNSKTYNIYDDNKIIGKASTYPNYLTVGSTLTKLKFYVLSTPQKIDYGSDLLGSLIVNVDPATLNCTGVNNYILIYLPHTINIPPYYIPLNWNCITQTIIPVTIALTDFNSGASVASASFNIYWASGTMIIDNVNVIKNTNNSNLELWATVSNIFTHDPIPTTNNLTCNYSVTCSSNSLGISTTFSGDMDIYLTNTTSGSLTVLQQTDAFNSSVDLNTNFTYRDECRPQINCTADNYTSASISTTRWVSAKRVKTFVCYIGTETTQDHTVYYTDPYHTQASNLLCITVLDTDIINASADNAIINWLQNSSSLYLTLYSNYLSNDVNSPCPELRVLQTKFIYKNNQKVGIQTNYLGPIGSLYPELPSCSLTPIIAGLITNNLVQFNAGDSFNSTTQTYYPTTTVVPAFNLTYWQGATIANPVSAIENTKTSNISIVTVGDIISCSTAINDPSNDISTVVYTISETAKGQSCGFAYQTTFNQVNSTSPKTYSNSLSVNTATCHFFSVPDTKGLLKCTAIIYYSGQLVPITLYSNTLPYLTPKSGVLPYSNITILACSSNISINNPNSDISTMDFWDLFKPNCPNFVTRIDPLAFFGKQMRDEPEMFVMEFFLIIIGLFIFAILIIPVAKLFISLRNR